MGEKNTMQSKQVLSVKYTREFVETFGAPLREFMEPIMGFNLGKFIDFLDVPDDISCSEHVYKKYGKGAKNLITELIKI
jgi:hypothetical protein